MSYPRFSPSEYGAHCVSIFEDFRDFAPPKPEVRDAYLTILAKASKNYGVGIAAWCLMSNHPHVFAFDRDPDKPSQLGQFGRFVNSVFAQWLDQYWNRKGGVFDRNALPQRISILDAAKERQQICYIENNFLAAGVLDPENELVGMVSRREYLLEPLEIPRPDKWFQPRTWPKKAEIQLEVPPCSRREGTDLRTFYFRSRFDLAAAQMIELERILVERLELKTPADLLDATPDEPGRRKVNHALAPCTGTHRADIARFYDRVRGHRKSYYKSLGLVRDNKRHVVFPWGTDKMVNQYGFKMERRPG